MTWTIINQKIKPPKRDLTYYLNQQIYKDIIKEVHKDDDTP